MTGTGQYRYVFMAFLCIVAVCINGCTFLRLSKEVKELEQVKIVAGSILERPNPDKNLLVLAIEDAAQGRRIAKAIILAPGEWKYAIEIGLGSYYLIAFEDLNGNLAYDRDEPFGVYGAPTRFSITPSTPTSLTTMDISFEKKSIDYNAAVGKIVLSQDTLSKSFVKIGQVVSFDSPLLDHDCGVKGYWEPLAFIREIGFCVLFQEPYDRKKIPVLFIHGAVGTPLGWKETVEHLDRKRFQPWFYYYPSGLSLNKLGKALNSIVMVLHERYGFKEMHVVAQSMGGLVARSFILQNVHDSRQTFIKSFISISTPWNGHKLTAKGVERAPSAIPSWYDMVPDSEFIQTLYKRKFPPSLHHYLLFSYKGDCSLFLANNDGTVELSSELDWRAQGEAERIFGYDEDHGSILFNKQVLLQIRDLLTAESRR